MEQILLIAGSAVSLILIFRLMTAPIRLVWKLAINFVCGFVVLILCNLLGTLLGISLGLNLLSTAVVALLGLPGVGLLLLLQCIIL